MLLMEDQHFSFNNQLALLINQAQTFVKAQYSLIFLILYNRIYELTCHKLLKMPLRIKQKNSLKNIQYRHRSAHSSNSFMPTR